VRQLAILIAAVGLIAGLYLGLRHRTVRGEPASDGSTVAPRLTAVDLSGNRIDTASLQGKVVLINFWAAWCTPCTAEIPQFVALQDKYGPRGLQTIGISMDDKEPVLREFYRKNKMNYPVVAGTQKIAQEYGGVLGLPTTFLIGRDGRIHAKLSGAANFPELERQIAGLLQAGK
jgi:peroxiredoxin